MNTLSINNLECKIIKLLGKGKCGYSYLVSKDNRNYVLKQIHHEPCDYYTFGNKLESEINAYHYLNKLGIPLPKLLEIDIEQERILKEYIDGETIFELVLQDECPSATITKKQNLCHTLYSNHINIDYEFNQYMEKWDFENWGIHYWSKTPLFLEYLEKQNQ